MRPLLLLRRILSPAPAEEEGPSVLQAFLVAGVGCTFAGVTGDSCIPHPQLQGGRTMSTAAADARKGTQ